MVGHHNNQFATVTYTCMNKGLSDSKRNMNCQKTPQRRVTHQQINFFCVTPWQSNCQGWCRYPAGVLASVRSGAEIGLLSVRLSVFKGASLGDFLLAPVCPIEKVTLWEGFVYLIFGIWNRWRCCERQSFCRTGNRLTDPATLSQQVLNCDQIDDLCHKI